MNKINTETLGLIKEFEGLELSAYKDPVGIWTIGYGHTAAAGLPHPKAGMKLTEKEATDLLLRDLTIYENAVRTQVKVPLNDNQYGSLVSFTYNVGPGNFAKSTLLKKLNAKDYTGAANEFAKWNKAKGKVLNGLTRRRAAEKKLFLTRVSSVPVQEPKPNPVSVPSITPKPSVAPSVGILGHILNLLSKLFRR